MPEPAVLHVEPFEHSSVEMATGAVAGLAMGVTAAGGEGGGELQDLLPFAQVGVEVSEAILGRGEVGADAGLLGFEGGNVDGAAVVGVGELAPCGLGLGDPAGEQFPLDGVGDVRARTPSRGRLVPDVVARNPAKRARTASRRAENPSTCTTSTVCSVSSRPSVTVSSASAGSSRTVAQRWRRSRSR